VEDRASQYFLGGGTPAKNEFTEKVEIYAVSPGKSDKTSQTPI